MTVSKSARKELKKIPNLPVGTVCFLDRMCRAADGGWGPVTVLTPPDDSGILRVRDGLGGDEYPADVADLRTARQAAESLLPARTGSEKVFRANGNRFRVKRHRYEEYSLFQEGVHDRSRWGTKKEMLADLAHAVEFGRLHSPSGPRW